MDVRLHTHLPLLSMTWAWSVSPYGSCPAYLIVFAGSLYQYFGQLSLMKGSPHGS
jgi:hypothetical protein